MKTHIFKRVAGVGICLLLTVSLLFSCGQGREQNQEEKAATKVPQLSLQKHDGGFFSIDKPVGWHVVTAGQCSDFAFLLRDPAEPLRQVFYFGQVGPVYMSARQKQIDQQYMQMGGYPVGWIEMPVVDPLTPERFLSQFHLVARTRVARQFMPQCPRLEQLQVISRVLQQSPVAGGATELIRALFVDQGRPGEGLFLVTVIPFMQFTGGPGGGNAFGLMIAGITAPHNDFIALENLLVKSLESFTVNQEYVKNCMMQQSQAYVGILKAGRTLSEASDMIVKGWQNRNRSDDIMAAKRSDAILGKERLYDPGTGTVYEFESGFYDQYNTNRGEFEMNNLQALPGDHHELWTTPTLDGPRHIR